MHESTLRPGLDVEVPSHLIRRIELMRPILFDGNATSKLILFDVLHLIRRYAVELCDELCRIIRRKCDVDLDVA